MKGLRVVLVALALFQAAWIAFDGARALATGEYSKPRIGSYGGRMGAWTKLAWAAGVSPRSDRVKLCLVVYGLLWGSAAMAFARGALWAWWPMILAAVGALWYSILAIPLSFAQVILLLAARRDL
jgi:hypothetical protein